RTLRVRKRGPGPAGGGAGPTRGAWKPPRHGDDALRAYRYPPAVGVRSLETVSVDPMRAGLSRREFVTALSVALLGSACGPSFDPRRFHVPRASAVGLFPASSYAVDFADLIFRGFQELDISLTGRRVFLKPNMVEYEIDTAINTPPPVVAGAAIACRRAGASEVLVGEGPGHRRDMEYLLTSTGLSDQLREQAIQS